MDKKELEKLESAVRAASAAHWKVDNERHEAHRDLISRARSEIAEAMSREFGKRLEATASIVRAATAARDAARIELANAGGGKYRPGQKMVEWRRKPAYASGPDYSVTGRVGLIEVYTNDTVVPERFHRSYRKPEIGELVLRPMKADGTPGVKIEMARGWSGDRTEFHNWFSEGVNPNDGEKS